jgi:thymidylate synthase (FAD)
MRYIKVGVPDDFDETSIENPHIGDWTQDKTATPIEIWTPPYRNVLNHGFIGLVDFMGDDARIVNSARVSYGKGTKKVRKDRGLIRYLMRHRHTTPFEMVELMFHVKAPIFVFRQWHRHRTASINEYSGRYSILEDEMYIPEHDHAAPQSKVNNQGRQDNLLDDNDYLAVLAAVEQVFHDSYATYEYLVGSNSTPPDAINTRKLWVEECAVKAAIEVRKNMIERDEELSDEDAAIMLEDKIKEYYAANELAIIGDDFPGMAKELARIVLPVATYSQMYWKANLKNLLHFIGLRSDPHAQYEIRVYSDIMLEMIKPVVPWAVEAFLDYQMNGANLSTFEIDAVKSMVDIMKNDDLVEGSMTDWLTTTLKAKGASQREIDEFIVKVGA